MLIFYNIGYATSLVPVIDFENTAKWTAVSCFLSLTTLFYAVALADDTARRTDVLLRGYIFCAVITSIIAVLAYFKAIPGWENFILALRAPLDLQGSERVRAVPGPARHDRPAADDVRPAARSPRQRRDRCSSSPPGCCLSFSRGAWGAFRRLGRPDAVLQLPDHALERRSPAHHRVRGARRRRAGGVHRRPPVDRRGRRPVQGARQPGERTTTPAISVVSTATSSAG